jgi:uncharacterized protein (TIGR03437 family)
MNGRNLVVATLAAIPVLLFADVNGADPKLTNAPGDGVCTSCHSGTALNAGGGSVKIILPGDNTYKPGVTQRIQVRVADSAQRRWGFELTARVDASPTTLQAGDFNTVDSNAKVICANGRSKPCAASSPIQFVTHTQAGTRLGTTGAATFEVDWTPPEADVGAVTLYAAGNAANGNNANTGDHIYTASLTLSPSAASTPAPSISSSGGVVNAASYQPTIAPNTWVTITGANLSASTRVWGAQDLTGGALPTSLDGVSVTVNGKAAYVEYISPTQVNVLTPSDTALGPVDVKVAYNGQSSPAAAVSMQATAPAFFLASARYLAATHVDGSLVGPAGLFAQAPAATTPAKPGETILLYGTGFGAAAPAIADGQLTDKLASLSALPVITIGGITANVSFAGLIPGYAGLYQLNVEVPSTASDGDQSVIATATGAASPSSGECCYIAVQR